MPATELITGLDIGSTTIRAAVAQTNGGSELHILGLAEVPSQGIHKGVVTSIEDAVSAISSVWERVERMTGTPVEHVWASINGSHILAQSSHGVIAVSKADGEIKEDDVDRVVEAAQAVATPPNYEILHVLPRSFVVDNQAGIKDPVGMTGVRLEVEAQIIEGQSAQIKNLTKCIYRTGVDIDDLVLAILANAEVVLTKRQKELGVVLVNLGGSTTSMLVFEEGDPLHTAILPVGSGHITNDIAIGLRTSIDLAERLKLEYGHAVSSDVGKREDIDLAEISPEEGRVSRKQLAEIIEARLVEIFSLVNKELERIDRKGMLPAGVVLTGGGAKLPGVVEVAKREFKLPASLGYPVDVASPLEKVNDLSFTTAIGLARWGEEATRGKSARGGFGRWSSINHVAGRMKDWFKSLMP
ncbi:TPA: cell division protein FtsA [Patescibacteria group bacterium]|nr:MAG: Cell division protein ftsA [Parcubacteria group bacterium GW2011_GWA2_46_39]HBV33581.1 cell division protein FtsA [Patescibacteria group bacterium]HCU48109.1 cell division protein FtsA [Patescibacteria group bacterium]